MITGSPLILDVSPRGLATSRCQCGPHRVYHRPVVRFTKNCTAGDKSIRPGRGHLGDVVDFYAAIHLEADVPTRRVNAFSGLLDLAQRRIDETLAAKPRVDAHA